MSEDKKTIVKMAHIYTQEGRWDKAITEYKKLTKLDPEDFNSLSMLGDVYVRKGEIQPAFEAYVACSDAYVRLGQLEKAALVQSKIARLDTGLLDSESKKKQLIFQKQVAADRAVEAGEFDKAIDAYQQVLKLDPDRFDLYQKLGDLYLRKGELDKACKKYLEIAEIYFKNKLLKKAAPAYLKVVELDPENVDAHAALAEIQIKSGNESEAKKELLLLTEFLFQRGDLERTWLYAQKGEQLKSIESYCYLGHVELRRGKAKEARGWFEKLLKFKLNHGGALWGMGVILKEEGKADDAIKSWAKVPKSDRYYAETLASWAEVLEKKEPAEGAKKWEEAAEAFKAKGSIEAANKATLRAAGGGGGTAPAAAATAIEGPRANMMARAAEAAKAQLAAAKPVEPKAPEVKPLEAPKAAEAPKPAEPKALEPTKPAEPKANAGPPPLPGLSSSAAKATELQPLPTIGGASKPAAAAPPPLPTPAPASAVPAAAVVPSPAPVAASPAPEEAAEALGGDELESLLALAENFEGEGSTDEAINLYQRVLALSPGHPKAKEGLAKAYRKLAGNPVAPGASLEASGVEDELPRLAAMQAQAEIERVKAAEEAKRQAEQLAKAEAEAKRLAEDRAKAEAEEKRLAEETAKAEERAKAEHSAKATAEAEARRKAEDESKIRAEAEAKIRAETEARLRIEIEARQRAEMEAKRQAEEATLQAAEMRRRLETEIRAQLEEEMRKKTEEAVRKDSEATVARKVEEAREKAKSEAKSETETNARVEAVRAKEEGEAKKKIQSDVLARVQAQQKEKLAPLQKTIEEIRKKMEEQALMAQGGAAAVAASKAEPAPAPAASKQAPPKAAPAAAAAEAAEGDGMEDFMTAAVADIYVKQGLVKEAERIYERILAREPGNAEVRAKLEALTGKKTPGAAPSELPQQHGGPSAPGAGGVKKSKVSYL